MKRKKLPRRIRVTQQDIDRGVPKNTLACPISLALHRAFPLTFIEVFGEEMSIGKKSVPLPARIKGIVEQYDRGDFVGPFSFQVVL